MAVVDPVHTFVGERWRVAHGRDKIPNPNTIAFNVVLRSVWEVGWRAVTEENPISGIPLGVGSLVMQCCAHDPALRPTFEEVLGALQGPCAEEARNGIFSRWASPSLNAAPEKKGMTENGDHRDELVKQTENPMRESANFRRLTDARVAV